MTGRDRMVIIAVALVVALGAAWMLVVSPERGHASALNAQVASAKAQLASAEGQVASARTAQSQYAAAYTAVVSLGKAVPPSQEVPSLIYQLTRASDQKNVDFSSIATTTSSASSTPASASAASQAAAGFTQLPFTFVFEGSFFDLEHLFRQLTGFTTQSASGALRVSGRLLTVQSVKLAPSTSGTAQGTGVGSHLTGTITATAYVLPASQGLTAAASAASPTGATTPASSTTGASSSPTAPAIVRVTP
jgi:Tfp pilus assembly protein PilO